jgi:hypothetical protein
MRTLLREVRGFRTYHRANDLSAYRIDPKNLSENPRHNLSPPIAQLIFSLRRIQIIALNHTDIGAKFSLLKMN